MPTMMTTDEAAEFLRVTARTLAKWRKARTGPPGHRTGRRFLYDKDELTAWVKQRPE